MIILLDKFALDNFDLDIVVQEKEVSLSFGQQTI